MFRYNIPQEEYVKKLIAKSKKKYEQALKRAAKKGIPYFTDKVEKGIQDSMRVCTS